MHINPPFNIINYSSVFTAGSNRISNSSLNKIIHNRFKNITKSRFNRIINNSFKIITKISFNNISFKNILGQHCIQIQDLPAKHSSSTLSARH